MSIELPTKKVPAESQDPKYLILFGLPKVGKTTILSTLENNLILDFENGSTYVDALKIKIGSLKELKDVCKAIKEAGCPYRYITIDTITSVEEMAKPLALQLYLNTVQGSTFTGKNVLDAPMGAGYAKVREAIEMIIDMVAKCAPNIIICGHVKDAALTEGATNNVRTLDLTGKTSRILSAKSDAIGLIYTSPIS